MAINWSLLGNQQNQFQNAMAMGAQVGSAAAERKNQEGYRNALMSYDPSNPDSAKDVMRYNPDVGFKLQQQAALQQRTAQEREMGAVPVVLRMLQAAKNNPEQYGAILSQAQRMGIPGVERAPQQFDPGWIDGQIATLSAFTSPQGREALSTAGKEAADAGFQPGTAEFNDFVRNRLTAGDRKTIPFQPGGGVIEYDPSTGQTRILAAPSGAPGVMEIPPPPEGYTLDGDVSGNAGGGF